MVVGKKNSKLRNARKQKRLLAAKKSNSNSQGIKPDTYFSNNKEQNTKNNDSTKHSLKQRNIDLEVSGKEKSSSRFSNHASIQNINHFEDLQKYLPVENNEEIVPIDSDVQFMSQKGNVVKSSHFKQENQLQSSPLKQDDQIESSHLRKDNIYSINYLGLPGTDKKVLFDELVESVKQLTHDKTQSNVREDNTMEGILQRFYGMLMGNDSNIGQNELETVLYIFNFYQKYIKTLKKNEAEMKENNKRLQIESESNKYSILQYEKEKSTLIRMNSEILEEKKFVEKKSKIYEEEINRYRKEVIEIEDRYKSSIEKYKLMIDETSNGYSQAKETEISLVQKLSKFKFEWDLVSKDNLDLRSQVLKSKGESDKFKLESERLVNEMDSIRRHLEQANQEKQALKAEVFQLTKKNGDFRLLEKEVETRKMLKEKLKKTAENLIDEVCHYKLEVKELQMKNQYLMDMNELAKRSEKKLMNDLPMKKQQDNNFLYNLINKEMPINELRTNKEYCGKDANYNLENEIQKIALKQEYYPTNFPPKKEYSHANFIAKQKYSHGNNSPMKKTQPHLGTIDPKLNFSHRKRSGDFRRANNNFLKNEEDIDLITNLPKGKTKFAREPKNLMIFPAHKNIEMNKENIRVMNKELSDFQIKKVMIESELCKMPSHPRKLMQKERKEELENELFSVTNKMYEIKRNLRDMQVF